MSSKVKICGITRVKDAIAAVEAGADALGFMFYEKSPRHLGFKQAAEIIRELPAFVAKVGVFVDATEEFVRAAIGQCGLDTLQFHGDEMPEFCRRFGLKAIKAFRVRDEQSLRAFPAYDQETWLLDSFVAGTLGGTGAIFNWELARKAGALNHRILLAGGLTPENVAEAVKQVQPYGVDVSSGVESKPGQKDPRKLREFIARAKGL